MAKTSPLLGPELLAATLEGLLMQKQRLEQSIAEVRRLLNGTGRTGRPAEMAIEIPLTSHKRTRQLSAAARNRIADAQKRRWAAYREQKQANS